MNSRFFMPSLWKKRSICGIIKDKVRGDNMPKKGVSYTRRAFLELPESKII